MRSLDDMFDVRIWGLAAGAIGMGASESVVQGWSPGKADGPKKTPSNCCMDGLQQIVSAYLWLG